MPTEKVLLLSLPFPNLPDDKLREAAVYAAEPYVVQPIDAVHVSMGPPAPDGGHRLLLVIDIKYLAQLRREFPGCTILPDALLLPTPEAGTWAAMRRGDVMIFRLPDGTGLAGQAHVVQTLWKQAGSPQITQYGPDDISVAGLPVSARNDMPLPPSGEGFDIRDMRDRRRDARRAAIWIVASLAVVTALHLSLAVYETARLRQRADMIETSLRTALTERGFAADGPIDAAVTAALSTSNRGDGSGFLSLLNTSMEGLKAQSGLIAVEKLTYSSDENALELALVGTFLPDLQDAAKAMSMLDLHVEAGTATSTDSEARMTLTVRSKE